MTMEFNCYFQVCIFLLCFPFLFYSSFFFYRRSFCPSISIIFEVFFSINLQHKIEWGESTSFDGVKCDKQSLISEHAGISSKTLNKQWNKQFGEEEKISSFSSEKNLTFRVREPLPLFPYGILICEGWCFVCAFANRLLSWSEVVFCSAPECIYPNQNQQTNQLQWNEWHVFVIS